MRKYPSAGISALASSTEMDGAQAVRTVTFRESGRGMIIIEPGQLLTVTLPNKKVTGEELITWT